MGNKQTVLKSHEIVEFDMDFQFPSNNFSSATDYHISDKPALVSSLLRRASRVPGEDRF